MTSASGYNSFMLAIQHVILFRVWLGKLVFSCYMFDWNYLALLIKTLLFFNLIFSSNVDLTARLTCDFYDTWLMSWKCLQKPLCSCFFTQKWDLGSGSEAIASMFLCLALQPENQYLWKAFPAIILFNNSWETGLGKLYVLQCNYNN